jgi:type III pantothenate kinase
MQLLIDIGNTSIKWAVHDGSGLTAFGSARHHGGLPIDLVAAWEGLAETLAGPAGTGRGGITDAVAAKVGPDAVLDAVGTLTQACWGCVPRPVETCAEAAGVRVAYAEPARLGVDRFLALIGAHPLGSGAKLIIDAGTAITFDLLRADGTHLGGLILPGLALMRDSLLAGTAIPPHEVADTDRPWTADTGGAIAAASLQAPAALAERLVTRLHQVSGDEPIVIVTGGDGERLRSVLDRPSQLCPELTLLGLARLA